MTLRQRLLKRLYPLLMWAQQKKAKATSVQNIRSVVPPVSFYSLSVTLNNGTELPFEKLRGKKVLLVNTASDCGYTHQYAEMQTLYESLKEDVEIIAFPANDFKEQEKGSDADIAQFCAVNYGVSFAVTKKTVVKKGSDQHWVYQWLTDPGQNGWNNKQPSWNFAKFLVNEQGVLIHYFEPGVSPLSAEMIRLVQG